MGGLLIRFWALALTLGISLNSLGQGFTPGMTGYSEVGFNAGLASYHGDLQPIYKYNLGDFSVGGYYRRNVSPAFHVRVQLSYSQISGNSNGYPDNYKPEFVDYSFSTPITEGAVILEYNFFDFRYDPNRSFSPYFAFGLGLMNFSPQPIEEDAQGTNSFQGIIPIGIGMKFNLNKVQSLAFHTEFLSRLTFTDQLDNTAGVDPESNLQRGEKGIFDWYGNFTVGLSYTFYKLNCPTNFVY